MAQYFASCQDNGTGGRHDSAPRAGVKSEGVKSPFDVYVKQRLKVQGIGRKVKN